MNGYLARLAAVQHWRGRRWAVATGLVALGLVSDRLTHASVSRFGDGVMLGLIVAWSFGWADDRMTGFSRVLPNYFSTAQIFLQRLAAGLIFLTTFFILAFALAVLFEQDLHMSAWDAVRLFLVMLLLLPLTVLAETLIDVRLPAAISSFLAMVAIFTLFVSERENLSPLISRLGLDVPRGVYDFGRFALVAIVWNAIAFIFVYVVWRLKNREPYR